MVQGGVKKSAAVNPGKTKPSRHVKRGAISKPKKAVTNADKTQKKYVGGMVAKTEIMLGERAGHLELIGKGRKKGAERTEEFVKAKKGGSRKFEMRESHRVGVAAALWIGLHLEGYTSCRHSPTTLFRIKYALSKVFRLVQLPSTLVRKA
ncbi:hypothetical protein B0T19DRAFT_441724 [Cercophora scortea]|uniref:Uncharacterized protein n=1 Tax=Cercophora scortea TaxID=314031 RepID=A0AAE0MCS0_9PEZI|nr:hypothetical protein B0T19DRAFT_441724 [Cercophora scortea]